MPDKKGGGRSGNIARHLLKTPDVEDEDVLCVLEVGSSSNVLLQRLPRWAPSRGLYARVAQTVMIM